MTVAGKYIGPWYATPHAISRYIERCRPGISPARARFELITLMQRVEKIGKGRGGIDEYRSTRYRRLIFRVTRQPLEQLPTLLTVYVSGHGQEQREATKRLRARLERDMKPERLRVA